MRVKSENQFRCYACLNCEGCELLRTIMLYINIYVYKCILLYRYNIHFACMYVKYDFSTEITRSFNIIIRSINCLQTVLIFNCCLQIWSNFLAHDCNKLIHVFRVKVSSTNITGNYIWNSAFLLYISYFFSLNLEYYKNLTICIAYMQAMNESVSFENQEGGKARSGGHEYAGRYNAYGPTFPRI